MKRCDDCGHCVLVDYGYSNYTVEGTTVYCAINAHQSVPFDRWYGLDDRMQYAQKCPSFTKKSPPVRIDVDREDQCNVDGPGRWANYATELVTKEQLYDII